MKWIAKNLNIPYCITSRSILISIEVLRELYKKKCEKIYLKKNLTFVYKACGITQMIKKKFGNKRRRTAKCILFHDLTPPRDWCAGTNTNRQHMEI